MQEITSRKNPLVQHLKKLGTDKAYRETSGAFLCDGIKLYEEAVKSGAHITVFATSDPNQINSLAEEMVLLPQDVLASVSPQKSPQTLLFACSIPKQKLAECPERVLILENIQDPGNLGTLIRTASAFSIDQVILTGDTADLYHPKTVRSTMGAIFHQNVIQMSVDEIKNYVNQNELHLLGAALGKNGVTAGEDLPPQIAIAIGSEGQGLSQELLHICHSTIQIPMSGAVESLNAAIAGAVLMWELYRAK